MTLGGKNPRKWAILVEQSAKFGYFKSPAGFGYFSASRVAFENFLRVHSRPTYLAEEGESGALEWSFRTHPWWRAKLKVKVCDQVLKLYSYKEFPRLPLPALGTGIPPSMETSRQSPGTRVSLATPPTSRTSRRKTASRMTTWTTWREAMTPSRCAGAPEHPGKARSCSRSWWGRPKTRTLSKRKRNKTEDVTG